MKSYILPGGEKLYATPHGFYPSVTTVLEKTRPRTRQAQLSRWRKRVGEAEAEKIRLEAAARGTAIHALLASHMAGDSVDCPLDLLPFWQALKPIVRAIGAPLAIECPVRSARYRYAGTLDLLAHWRDELTLFDLKTSHREKSAAWLGDAKLQIAAYAGAYEEMHGIRAEGGMILVASPSGTQLFDMDRAALDTLWSEWETRLEEFYGGAWRGFEDVIASLPDFHTEASGSVTLLS